jgi:hypothetical protein
MHERVFEAVACALPTIIAELLDQIGLDKAVDCGFPALCSRCYALQKPDVELGAQYGCLLEETSVIRGNTVNTGQQESLQGGGNFYGSASSHALPAIPLTDKIPLAEQAASDLLNEQRIASRARSNEIMQLGERFIANVAKQTSD